MDSGNATHESWSASTARPAVSAAPRLLAIDPERFREHFNRRQFEVSHRLAEHPLFQIPRLLELAREMTEKWPSDIYYDAGVEDIGSRWSGAKPDFRLDDTILRLKDAKAWIDLKSAERSREYGKILNTCIADLLQLSGPQLERSMRRKQMAIFITSPNRISTYHIDSEVNFLLQLQGEKEISIFDRADREVLPEQEIELFWSADRNAAVYKPQLQHRADVVKLRPGGGVHIPVNAPHWVRNGNNISVSVAILYHSWSSAYANIYGANYALRKLGLKPTPPFRSPTLDLAKQPLGAAFHRLRKLRHGAFTDTSGNAAGIPDRTPPEHLLQA